METAISATYMQVLRSQPVLTRSTWQEITNLGLKVQLKQQFLMDSTQLTSLDKQFQANQQFLVATLVRSS